MVFGLFTRKSTADEPSPESHNARLPTPTPTPSVASVAHNSPLRFSTTFHTVLGGSTSDPTLKDSDAATDSVADVGSNIYFPPPPPPETPTPPPGSDQTKALFDLMLSIPPKTLHAYTLAHLRPQPPVPSTSASSVTLPDSVPRPPSPNTVSKLTTFYSTLAPPPLLHCVRCHKDFYDVENEDKDKACRVPHDDESALVSRVSGGGYETLWGCCGQTASGDGSEGPPDGWCYEGRHTTDIRRARFRADSTIHDDKLTSCLRLNCRGIRDQFPRADARGSPSRNVGSVSARRSNPSPVRSLASIPASRSSRKRPRKSLKEASASEDEADADTESSAGRASTNKRKEKASDTGETSMAVDEPESSSKPRTKAKSRPISRAGPPLNTSATAPLSAKASKARTTSAKPKSTSTMLLSQSHTHPGSDSEAPTRARPRTRSHVRGESRARDASRGHPTSKAAKTADNSEWAGRTRKSTRPVSRSSTFREERGANTDDHRESEQEGRGRDRKKRRVGRD